MKRFFLLLMLLTSIYGYCGAQSESFDHSGDDQRNIRVLGREDANAMVRTYDNRYEGVKGSPYYFPVYYAGKIRLKDQEEDMKMSFAYNISNDCLEFIVDELPQSIPLKRVKYFSLIDSVGREHLFVIQEIPLEAGTSEPMVLEVLYKGESTFYRRPLKEFRTADYTGAYSQDQRSDEFVDRSIYYLRPKGGTFFDKVKINRSSILKRLAAQKVSVKSFLKQERMYIQNETEVIRVLQYYDSLP